MSTTALHSACRVPFQFTVSCDPEFSHPNRKVCISRLSPSSSLPFPTHTPLLPRPSPSHPPHKGKRVQQWSEGGKCGRAGMQESCWFAVIETHNSRPLAWPVLSQLQWPRQRVLGGRGIHACPSEQQSLSTPKWFNNQPFYHSCSLLSPQPDGKDDIELFLQDFPNGKKFVIARWISA